MARPLSVLATGIWMLVLAAASWGLVAASWAMTGTVSLPALVMALMFTGLVAAFPFLVGNRAQAHVEAHHVPCRACGAPPFPGIRFCIRCGAYPKAAPARGERT